ncbi:MAG: hypothetical protein IKE37_01695 [Firmicutes bacterium]|nr:hypothetical protein [Bacillota bacterium]
MSFADELRKETKTPEQLEAERREKEGRDFRFYSNVMFNHMKESCSMAARNGKREASERLRSGIGDTPFVVSFNTREEALRYADEVKARLIAEGLTDTSYKLESFGHFSNKSYQVRFTIKW